MRSPALSQGAPTAHTLSLQAAHAVSAARASPLAIPASAMVGPRGLKAASVAAHRGPRRTSTSALPTSFQLRSKTVRPSPWLAGAGAGARAHTYTHTLCGAGTDGCQMRGRRTVTLTAGRAGRAVAPHLDPASGVALRWAHARPRAFRGRARVCVGGRSVRLPRPEGTRRFGGRTYGTHRPSGLRAPMLDTGRMGAIPRPYPCA